MRKLNSIYAVMGSLFIVIFLFVKCENYIFDNEEISLKYLTFSVTSGDQDWSHDGSKIVYNRWVDEHTEVWIVDVITRETWKVRNGFDPTWHPTDNVIAFEDDGEIYTMRSDGTIIQRHTNSHDFDAQPAWNNDGSKITYSVNMENIWIMNSDGTEKKQLTFSSDGVCCWHSFSYDGTQIVYSKSQYQQSENKEIWIMNADGSDKHSIYAPGSGGCGTFQRAWNKDNKIVFARDSKYGNRPCVWIMNADGTEAKVLLDSQSLTYNDPVWDASGENIAVSVGPAIGGNPDKDFGGMICIFEYK